MSVEGDRHDIPSGGDHRRRAPRARRRLRAERADRRRTRGVRARRVLGGQDRSPAAREQQHGRPGDPRIAGVDSRPGASASACMSGMMQSGVSDETSRRAGMGRASARRVHEPELPGRHAQAADRRPPAPDLPRFVPGRARRRPAVRQHGDRALRAAALSRAQHRAVLATPVGHRARSVSRVTSATTSTTASDERRKFFEQTFLVQLAIEHDTITSIQSETPPPTAGLELRAAVSRADRAARPAQRRASRDRACTCHHRARGAQPRRYGSWRYVRLLPEARAYQKLFWNIVLAERIAFGALFIVVGRPSLDPTSSSSVRRTYRLRGGGANSNRGFAAGTLGDGIDGGTRRWEGTVELRIPLSTRLQLGPVLRYRRRRAARADGSRSVEPHLNASTGLGLRFYTPFAPIRFDAGWRIPGLQTGGGETQRAVQNARWPQRRVSHHR